MQEFSLQARRLGVDLTARAYVDERVAGRWVQRIYTRYRLPHPVNFPPSVPTRSR